MPFYLDQLRINAALLIEVMVYTSTTRLVKVRLVEIKRIILYSLLITNNHQVDKPDFVCINNYLRVIENYGLQLSFTS
jgi:hypothetical protein